MQTKEEVSMTEREKLISEIEKHGTQSSGKNAMLKYLKGETIHRAAAVKAKCFDCCGYYADGRFDCENNDCPLYPYMPYRGQRTEGITEEIEETEQAGCMVAAGC
jgi:hypothetical protein